MKHFIRVFLYAQYLSVMSIDANPLLGNGITEAAFADFPFTASIVKVSANNRLEGQRCGGTLIAKKYILTAAHCLEDPITYKPQKDYKFYKVSIGTNDVTQSPLYGIKDYTPYRKWAEGKKDLGTLDHNIAVAELDKAVDDERVRIAKISPLSPQQLFEQHAVMTGWQPRFLQKGEVRVLSLKDSLDLAIHTDVDAMTWGNKVFTKGKESFVHMRLGDDGCPLVIDNHVVGINTALNVHKDGIDHPRTHNQHHTLDLYDEFIKFFTEKSKLEEKKQESRPSDPAEPSRGRQKNFRFAYERLFSNSPKKTPES